MKTLLAFLLFCSSLVSQTVFLVHYGDYPVRSWVRGTVDRKPPVACGEVDGLRFVLGRPIGSVWAIDIEAALEPGKVRVLALEKSVSVAFPPMGLPADPVAHFGGMPTFNGQPLQMSGIQADGAAYTAHFHGRTGRLFHVDFWARWYPTQPGVISGEMVVCASNPAVPDTSETFRGAGLRWGDADVVAGKGHSGGSWLSEAVFGDGQARATSVTLFWKRHLKAAEDGAAAAALAWQTIAVNGIEELWPGGYPIAPKNAARPTTINQVRWNDALNSLSRWEPPVDLGVAKNSGISGSQEDQVFVGWECTPPGGLGGEQIRYLTALAQLRRPCHHLSQEGALIDPSSRPGLIYWDGRPFFRTTSDRLGKPRELASWDYPSGWWGPDVEHALINTMAIGARLRDSSALQWGLRAQAMVYLGQWTSAPGFSTSQTYAARALGWEGLLVWHLWRGLEDRTVAEKVRQRFQDRVRLVILPKIRSTDVWDIRINDPRLGVGEWWIPWQQSVGAFGLDLAGEIFNLPELRQAALHAALRVCRTAWRLEGSTWLPLPQMAVDGRGTPDPSFMQYGMLLAPTVVLRHHRQDERARAIFNQSAASGGSWVFPEVWGK